MSEPVDELLKARKNTVQELLSLSTVHGISKIVNYESL